MNNTHRHRLLSIGALLASLCACTPIKLDPLDLGPGPVSASTTEEETTSTTGGESSGGVTGGDETLGATTSPCDQPISDCSLDKDGDGEIFECDNAPDHFNPDQADGDGDGFGDVIDRCPTLAGDNNVADADKDGIGNDCDLCRLQVQKYNKDGVVVAAYMKVRNIPDVGDADGDGIGDACDNCVRTPNCQSYGDGPGLTPYELGMPIDVEAADCQVDAALDMVGDACAGTMMAGAAGPVGLAPEDDFDQDGLTNVNDGCPRQPVAAQPCDGPEDCPEAAQCTDGVCNHSDHDNDGVGDACDTCPFDPNPKQVVEGQDIDDDPDGDFVGNVCEGAPQCFDRADPRPLGFYDANASGICCVELYDGGPLLDPDGAPVQPPPKVLATPGVGVLPPGCAAAAQPVTLADVGGDPAALWQFVCRLPQSDQDFDGVPYMCDFCPHTFDPGQENDGNYGKFCTGPYDPSELDPAMMCLPGT
jgi:hypothetical protein